MILQNQKFFVLFTFYIGLISYHRFCVFCELTIFAYILVILFHKFSTLNFSLFLGVHHFITCIHGDWKNCTTYRWKWDNFKIVQKNWKSHILFFFSPPATVVFILFLLFEVKDNNTLHWETFGVPELLSEESN